MDLIFIYSLIVVFKCNFIAFMFSLYWPTLETSPWILCAYAKLCPICCKDYPGCHVSWSAFQCESYDGFPWQAEKIWTYLDFIVAICFGFFFLILFKIIVSCSDDLIIFFSDCYSVLNKPRMTMQSDRKADFTHRVLVCNSDFWFSLFFLSFF